MGCAPTRRVGVHGLGVRNALILSETENRRGGVRFHVGRANWLVEIDLTFADLYDVRFVTRKSGRVGYEASGVYCDQLTEILLHGADACNV